MPCGNRSILPPGTCRTTAWSRQASGHFACGKNREKHSIKYLQKIPIPPCNPTLESGIFLLILKPLNHLFMRKFLSVSVLSMAVFFATAQPTTEAQDVLKLKET